MEQTVKKKNFKRFKPVLRECYDWAESVLIALVAVILILTFVIRGTVVDGRSMEPTLSDSQFLTMTNLYSGFKINDIVVVYAHQMYDDAKERYGKPIIKRVIGIAGDEISIDTAQGKVFRNGEELTLEVIEDIIYEDGHAINEYTRVLHSFPADRSLIIPENHVFVMGDNRNESRDSRDSVVGMVDENYIIGKVVIRITPFELFGRVK